GVFLVTGVQTCALPITPELESTPMVEIPRPIMAASTPLMGCLPSRLVRQQKANTISTKYSAGPNASAHLASSGASRMMPVTETMAPKNAEHADSDSATLAMPCRASG